MSIKKASILIIIILLIDQISKVYIKTHFAIGDNFEVFSWFQIYFIENEGMAWGAKLSDFISFIDNNTGKIILSIFRLIAIIGIGYWLLISLKKQSHRLLIVAISLIFSGALGNIIDSVFYGVLFNHSHGQIAQFLPQGGGYSSLLQGKVVDMLYFPLWEGHFPSWVPFYGGDYFTFFNPVFNIADTAISTGLGILVVFNKKVFPKKESSQKE